MKTASAAELPYVLLVLVVTLPAWMQAGVPPMQRYEALMKQQSVENLGLYNSSDKVIILTNANFNEVVLQKNHSTLVEFYNSYCGHCKRFAPHYKQLAEQLQPWRDVLLVGALDCAAEKNNDVCREYEVMAYPTMRYMGPGYMPSADNYGRPIETQDLDAIRSSLAQWLAAENRTVNMTSWPNFQNLTESEASVPFEGLDSQRKYVIMVYEPENSTVGIETALNLLRYPSVQVRRITDAELAKKFQIDGVHYKVATVDRKGDAVPYQTLQDSSQSYTDTIKSFLKEQHLTEKPTEATHAATTPNALLQEELREEKEQNNKIINEVQRNKHFVYQADLEMAIRGMIYNEIPKTADISGEKLLSLQRYLAVLQRYNPLGPHGRTLITKLYEFVMQHNQKITGKEFEDEVARLDTEQTPIFSANHYIGCSTSRPGLRGYTCSVWQLFHFMTVQAAKSELSQDPLEVLQAMHGYIKYFFGCTECAKHFQTMAARRKIWSTPNKEEAILWLWAAHNEVNQRLAGDSTEDPQFPKIQFPSASSCAQCYKQPIVSPANIDINWDKDAVLSFLKNIHNPEYVSRYGVEREDLLRPTLEKLRQKRMITNVFSDMDMRMGMLLYGFCIVMMIVAFKLFVFKGYRKKPYGHDLLGKV